MSVAKQYVDPYEERMKKIRASFTATLKATYTGAASDAEKTQIFNKVVDLLASEAGSMTMLTVLTGVS